MVVFTYFDIIPGNLLAIAHITKIPSSVSGYNREEA